MRDIPVRNDLEGYLTAYLDGVGLRSDPGDRPLFRRLTRKTRVLKSTAMTADDMGRMIKQRMSNIGLPEPLSPHSFRVATFTDLLTQGVPLEDGAAARRACRPQNHAALRSQAEESYAGASSRRISSV